MLSEDSATQLAARGQSVVRLDGPTRTETAIAIADHLMRQQSPERVLLARSGAPEDNPTAAWADAISGGALAAETGVPILLTQTEQLTATTRDWLDDHDVDVTVLGGAAAIADHVVAAVGGVRIEGFERAATAVAVSEARGAADGIVAFNGYAEEGWQGGLIGVGLAADHGWALLPVQVQSLPPAVSTWVSQVECTGYLTVGGPALIGTAAIEALDEACPGGRQR